MSEQSFDPSERSAPRCPCADQPLIVRRVRPKRWDLMGRPMTAPPRRRRVTLPRDVNQAIHVTLPTLSPPNQTVLLALKRNGVHRPLLRSVGRIVWTASGNLRQLPRKRAATPARPAEPPHECAHRPRYVGLSQGTCMRHNRDSGL